MEIMTQKELTNILNEASKKYYNGEDSGFSDTEFDLKMKELQSMEKASGIVYDDSPTQRVGSDVQKGFKKGRHPKPMLTIENTYDDEGLRKWVTDMTRKYGVVNFNMSVKYDGVSCELKYVDGKLVQALTRGDKNVGDDITANVLTISSIPRVLTHKLCKDETLYVRGEILLPKSKLEAINEEREARGLQKFANARNACSGSIKQLDPRVTEKRGLIFRAWDCFFEEGSRSVCEYDSMLLRCFFLENLGFVYEEGTAPRTVTDLKIVNGCVEAFKKELDGYSLDYDYDGVVLKVNEVAIQDKIGTEDTRSIGWGIARKWNEEYEAKTDLIDVEWQVGRTGVVTPVGKLEPVECGGVTIANVTLHNVGFVEEMDLHKWNRLTITRSGGVIPYVKEIEHDILMEANDIYPRISLPEVCPVCGGKLRRDGVALWCDNVSCPAVVFGKITHFCSKDCMDIHGIGEAVVKTMLENGILSNIQDLYRIADEYTGDSLAALMGNGYGEKSCQNIIDSINNSKKQPFDRVLNGLSIPGVGKVVARLLANTFRTIDAMTAINDPSEYSAIDGIGEIMAKDIVDWFGTPENIHTLVTLRDCGLKMNTDGADGSTADGGLPLSGLKVCFTGKSLRFTGDGVEKFLLESGAECVNGVTRKLDYLVTGEKPGPSKVRKAEEYGIAIIEESAFYDKFNI